MTTQLLRYTNTDGGISIPAASEFPFGPYVRDHLPKLTVGVNAGRNTVTLLNQAGPLASDVANGTAWIYNVATGEIIANANELAADGTPYHAF